MMSRALLDAPVGAGEVSGCAGLPLEAQDGGLGRCGQVWLGVLHLRSVWFLPPDVKRGRGLTRSKPELLTRRTMGEKAAAASEGFFLKKLFFCVPVYTIISAVLMCDTTNITSQNNTPQAPFLAYCKQIYIHLFTI